MILTDFYKLKKGDTIYFTSKPNVLWTIESQDIDTLDPSGSDRFKLNNAICPYDKCCLLISSPTPDGRHNPRTFYILKKDEISKWTIKDIIDVPEEDGYKSHFYDLKLFNAEEANIKYLSLHMHLQNSFKSSLVYIDVLSKSNLKTTKIVYKNYKMPRPVIINGLKYWYCVEIIIGAKVDPFTSEVLDSEFNALNYTGPSLSLVKLATPGLIQGPVDLHWYVKDQAGNRIHLNGDNTIQVGFDYNTTTKKVIINNGDTNTVRATPYSIGTDTDIEEEEKPVVPSINKMAVTPTSKVISKPIEPVVEQSTSKLDNVISDLINPNKTM